MHPDDALRAVDLTVSAAADLLAIYRTDDVETRKNCWSKLRRALDLLDKQEK